jgi:hypothetical protein
MAEGAADLGGVTSFILTIIFITVEGEMLSSDGEKVGRTNNVPRGKVVRKAKSNRTPAVWVGKQCPIPL